MPPHHYPPPVTPKTTGDSGDAVQRWIEPTPPVPPHHPPPVTANDGMTNSGDAVQRWIEPDAARPPNQYPPDAVSIQRRTATAATLCSAGSSPRRPCRHTATDDPAPPIGAGRIGRPPAGSENCRVSAIHDRPTARYRTTGYDEH